MENQEEIKISTIGHSGESLSELQREIDDFLLRDQDDTPQKREGNYSKNARDTALIHLLLADVDELIDTDWDEVLGSKVDSKGFTMKPKDKYPRRK